MALTLLACPAARGAGRAKETLELSFGQVRARTNGPMLTQVKLTCTGGGLLEGRLELELKSGHELLTAPISGPDILRQKLRGVRRLIGVLLTALMAIVGWIALPWLLAALLAVTGVYDDWFDDPTGFVLMLSSPATMIAVTEFGPPVNVPLPLLIALNTMGYGGMLVLFRTLCLRGADRLLGRADPQHPPPYGEGLAPRGEAPG